MKKIDLDELCGFRLTRITHVNYMPVNLVCGIPRELHTTEFCGHRFTHIRKGYRIRAFGLLASEEKIL